MKYFWMLLFVSGVALACDYPTCPRQDLTPGATMQVELETLCEPGYTLQVRHVTQGMKKKVFKRYGLDWSKRSNYEVDHFINLGIGGSNDITNLWPQAYEPRPGAHEKDAAEDYLRHKVCGDGLPVERAQGLMRADWVKVYNMIGAKR